MRRVLVQQDESAIRFQQHVKFADDADQAQWHVQERRGALAGIRMLNRRRSLANARGRQLISRRNA